MVSKQIGSEYILRFDKGELLIETLLKFVKGHSVRSAWVQGIGAAVWAEVGYYNLQVKKYKFNKIEKLLEIGSLIGNITWLDGQPMTHLHIVLGDEKQQAYVGHLKELAVGGTCEVYLSTFDQAINRRHDPATRLNLLDI